MEQLLFLGALTYSLPIVILAGIVYLIVRSCNDQRRGTTSYRALMVYFYLVTGASVINMAIGLILFAGVAVSRAFTSDGISATLILASTLLGTGLVICVSHIYGRRFLERKMGKVPPTARLTYLFSMLVCFSIAGLVSLPLAVYQTVHHFIEGSSYSHDDPSMELAVAMVIVPLWAYYLLQVLRDIRQNKGRESEG